MFDLILEKLQSFVYWKNRALPLNKEFNLQCARKKIPITINI